MPCGVVEGIGSYLPRRILTNHEIALKVDTSDAWIVGRTGIRQRHIAGDDERTSTLAIAAGERALADAGMAAGDIDALILATSTPDFTFPATATTVQAALGCHGAAAFDMQAVCSGFVFALTTANAFLCARQAKTALVIGAETFSRILDWNDRTTCVLFGDGAGAVVLRAGDTDGLPASRRSILRRGILACKLRSDGRHNDKLYVDGGPSATGTVGVLRMQGREVFRHAVAKICEVMTATVADAGLQIGDIDLFVPHQANIRILEGTARKLGIPEAKIMVTLDKHGNTSAASIPLALDMAVKSGRLKKGDLVLIEAMGGGFTWGAVLLRW